MSLAQLPKSHSTAELQRGYSQLCAWFAPWERVIVAFSGGVDSTLVLKAAHQQRGAAVLAITADSPSLPRAELEESVRLAKLIGAKHLVIPTTELQNPKYRANDGSRCFVCKSTLYQAIGTWLAASAVDCSQMANVSPSAIVLVDGTNVDDLEDFRPGAAAAKAAGVRHPLLEVSLNKNTVRQMSKFVNLPTAEKPEMACLSSRIPMGIEVTEQKLRMIEAAELILREFGFVSCRVRYHELHSFRDVMRSDSPLTLARIEIPTADFPRFLALEAEGSALSALTSAVRKAGFAFVTLDLEGYRKGGTETPSNETPSAQITA